MENIEDKKQDNPNAPSDDAPYDLFQCKKCGETRKKYRAGKYPNGKDTKFVDEFGKEHSGRTCSNCHKNRAAQNYHLKKLAKEVTGNDWE